MLNLRTRLLLLQFLTVVITALLLSIGSSLLFVSSHEKLQKRHLIHLAKEGARETATFLQKLSRHVSGFAEKSLSRKTAKKPFEKKFQKAFVSLTKGAAVVSLLDSQGNEILKLVDGRQTQIFYNYLYDSVVQQSRRQPNQVQVGARLQDPQFGEPTLSLAYSRVDSFSNEFAGTLLLTIPLQKVEKKLLAIAKDDDASLALVSAQGELLTYKRSEQTFQQLPFKVGTHPVRQRLFNEDLMLVSNPVVGDDLRVLALVPWQIYRAEIYEQRWLAVAVCLLVTLLGAGFSWKITSLLTRNVDQLVGFAERVGQGDYGYQLPLDSYDEFNRLNNAFNRMVADLNRHRRSHDSLQKIIETIIDPLIVTDRSGFIVQVNHATLELFSCDAALVINRPLADLFSSPPVVLQRAEFAQGLLSSPVSNLETKIKNNQGIEIAVLFSSAPGGFEAEGFGVVCILKDITELIAVRDAREQALIQAENARRRIDVMLRSVPDGLVVTDQKGRILLMNPPAEKLLGSDSTGLVSDLARQLFDESDTMGRVIDIPLTPNGGPLKVMQVNASEVRDSQNRVSGLVMLLRDVSRERSMEQLKNEFISTAAHELRTPLTSILGYSELMLEPANKDRFSPSEQQEFLQEILSRAEALSHLIDDLLSISRIESGQPLTMEIAPTDIALVLEQVVKQFRLTSESHRYELSLQPVSGEVVAQVDASRLQQVLENLLSNAVKYSEEGSLICIRGENCQEFYRIVVEDEGIGMAPEQIERIFEQFYRVDYSNTKTSGLGIGMSIVKQIIEGHGGQIQIDSQLGKGTRIEISLPLT